MSFISNTSFKPVANPLPIQEKQKLSATISSFLPSEESKRLAKAIETLSKEIVQKLSQNPEKKTLDLSKREMSDNELYETLLTNPDITSLTLPKKKDGSVFRSSIFADLSLENITELTIPNSKSFDDESLTCLLAKTRLKKLSISLDEHITKHSFEKASLDELQILDLSKSFFTDHILGIIFEKATNLIEVDLSYNQNQDIPIEEIENGDFTKLQKLKLVYCNWRSIDSIVNRFIHKTAENIKELNIADNNSLGDKSFKDMPELKRIERFECFNTGISSKILHYIYWFMTPDKVTVSSSIPLLPAPADSTALRGMIFLSLFK